MNSVNNGFNLNVLLDMGRFLMVVVASNDIHVYRNITIACERLQSFKACSWPLQLWTGSNPLSFYTYHYTYRGTSQFPVRVCKNLGHYTVLMTTEKELRDLYHVIICYGTGLLGFAWFQTQFICLLWQARVLIPMMMMRTWKQLGWKF